MGTRDELLDRARNELFSHINHCQVIEASPDHQKEWMAETIEYLAERYPELREDDLTELRSVGLRFCKPAIPHGPDHTPTGSSERATEH
ncbi:MAG: hypothetical protein R3223_08150 [Longimicrobiales bacterium]|nr:hypothetical protein [Longimicrobiales bacterium]